MVTTKGDREVPWAFIAFVGWWCCVLGFVLGVVFMCSKVHVTPADLIEAGYGHYTVDQKTGVARFELIKPEDFKYVPKQPEKQ